MKMILQKILLMLIILPLQGKTVLISLGSACGPAMNLRLLNLRTEAYPFDWTVTPFESLYNAIEDDFRHWLQALTLRPGNEGVIDYYGIHFTHDWPTVHQPNIDPLHVDFVGNCTLFHSWQQALPAVSEKYNRRIARFKNACIGNKKVYFFRSEDNNQQHAVALRDLLHKKYPSLDFTLVIVANTHENWCLEGIKYFYCYEPFDEKRWQQIISELDCCSKCMPIEENTACLINELECSECQRLKE